MTIPLLLLGAAFLLILANGFFVAAEFGLVTVERPDAEKAAADGDRRARTVVGALKELSFQLSGTQLGITITSLVIGMLAEPALAHLLARPLTSTGIPEGAVSGVAVAVGMLLASAVQMVIGELVPKNWAVSRPLQVARFVAGPQAAFSRLFRPVIAGLNSVANRLVRSLGVEPAEELASARTPGELVSLARHSARAGALEQDAGGERRAGRRGRRGSCPASRPVRRRAFHRRSGGSASKGWYARQSSGPGRSSSRGCATPRPGTGPRRSPAGPPGRDGSARPIG